MFRKLSTISIASNDIDKVKQTYMDVFGFAAPVRSTNYDKGRYREHSLQIDDFLLELLQPLDPPEAPGPGGGMARFLRSRGEGLYLITVGMAENSETYSKRLESKGVKVYWDVPDSGVSDRAKQQRPEVANRVHPLIHPRHTHGVLWELGRFMPDVIREKAPASNPFKKCMAISVVVKDADVALKTYIDTLELDSLLRSTTYEKSGYREHTLPMGELTIQLLQPLVGPDAKSRGGDMARALRDRGEGLYHITVDVDDVKAYAKKVEAKGVKVELFEPETGKVTNGPSKVALPAGTVHGLIQPQFAHGVLWELGSFRPSYT